MTMYKVKEGSNKAEILEDFEYTSEGNDELSPQRILENNPEIIFGIPELELVNTDVFLSYPEYKTSRGNIDLLFIGSNGEIVIVETKLIRTANKEHKGTYYDDVGGSLSGTGTIPITTAYTDADITLSSNQLTIPSDGVYLIMYDVCLDFNLGGSASTIVSSSSAVVRSVCIAGTILSLENLASFIVSSIFLPSVVSYSSLEISFLRVAIKSQTFSRISF